MILNFRTNWSGQCADPDQTAPRGFAILSASFGIASLFEF